MADFRKYFYALAIVALLACSTVAVNAQTLSCFSLTATNQNVRIEGDAELVGDIVLGCSGQGYTTQAGTLISGTNITVSIPSTIITSKILNPGASTLVSEATLIVDDLKDQTCQPTGAQSAPYGTYYASSPSAGQACTTYYPGSRNHQVCMDTTNPGGLGVCQVYAKSSGPQNSYDGVNRVSGVDGCPVASCSNPNIFVAQPNGTGAVIFRGVPLDPPATGFTRYLRITNLRVNAAQSGLSAGNPLSQLTAIISFQGPAAVGLATIQTTVASILTGNGGTTVTADNTFLQCEYPTNTLNAPVDNPLIQECPASTSLSGSSSGNPSATAGHGWCTGGPSFSPSTAFAINTGANTHPVITYKEGFQTAWKARNMSEYLGANGSVLGNADVCGAIYIGSPCVTGNNNTLNTTQYYTYSGSNTPAVISQDIAQNNPQIRYFTESGFEEIGAASALTSGGLGFVYNGNAGSADAGTRLQSTISNIPQNAVVSVPNVVYLLNGKIVSGVAILVSTSTNNGQASINNANNASLTQVPAASALAQLQAGNNANCGNTTQIACSGYVDLTGPTATVTYEIVFSDPYSTEQMKIYPVVYYPAGNLTAKVPVLPQANVSATVSPYTFAPYIAQPGGNQVSSPLGQFAGTPRFVQTTGAASPLFLINRCNCSLLFPWVVSDNNYVTGIAVANTSADPTNTSLAVPGYTAAQSSGTVQLYLFGTIKGATAQTSSSVAAVYPGTDTQALAGSYATFIVNTGFTGYAIAQANFQYCHGLAFLFNATGAVPPVSYLGLVMDFGGLARTSQLIGDSLGQ